MTRFAIVAMITGIATLAAAPPLFGAAANPVTARQTHVIVIDKMKFGAVPPALHVGDTITWANRDMFRHTATARNGSFNVDLPPGKSVSMVVSKAGTIAFYCTFHPGMRGQFTVAK